MAASAARSCRLSVIGGARQASTAQNGFRKRWEVGRASDNFPRRPKERRRSVWVFLSTCGLEASTDRSGPRVRNDPKPRPDPKPSDNRGDGLVATMPRTRSKGVALVKVPALLGLMAATCWVVASVVSPWFVPPYLVAMALILFPSTGTTRRRLTASRLRRASTTASGLPDQGRPVDGHGGSKAGLENASGRSSTPNGGPSDDGSTASVADGASGSASTTAKPKRGRSRPRKVANKPTTEPNEVAPATWVEVGPGKFVRVETPTNSVPAVGPHAPVEPSPDLLPFHDGPIALKPESLEIRWEPAGSFPVAEQGPSPESNADPSPKSLIFSTDVHSADPDEVNQHVALESLALPAPAIANEQIIPGPDLNPSTVDGITPQVDRVESSVSRRELFPDPAQVGPGPDPERAATWPSTEPLEPLGSTGLESEETSDGLADQEKRRSSSNEEVETRSNVEVDGDLGGDVGWSQDLAPGDQDHYVDREVPVGFIRAFEVDQEARQGGRGFSPSFWLARVRRRRGGFDRPFGGKTPQRGFSRTARPNRRPIDPRRPPGRRVGRPRQITRTSPPRSPPGAVVGLGG